MSIDAKKMVDLFCPFIKSKCIGPKCVNWMSKDLEYEFDNDTVIIKRGDAKCRLWSDSQEYLR